jgi:thioredoxin 1
MELLTEKTFKSDVLGSKTPVLVDFYADWCGPCKMLGPVLDELSKDKDFDGKLRFAKLNTEEYPELIGGYDVQGIPCLIIFKNGKEASRIVGFAPKPVMKAKIQSALDSI